MKSLNGNMTDVGGIRGPLWLRPIIMGQIRPVGWNVYILRYGSWQYRYVLEWYGSTRTFSIWRKHRLLIQVRFG